MSDTKRDSTATLEEHDWELIETWDKCCVCNYFGDGVHMEKPIISFSMVQKGWKLFEYFGHVLYHKPHRPGDFWKGFSFWTQENFPKSEGNKGRDDDGNLVFSKHVEIPLSVLRHIPTDEKMLEDSEWAMIPKEN